MVYPLIEESEALDFKNLTEGYEYITASFPLPKYKVSIVHGKLKPAEKDAEMERFLRNETQIMVATTVIEVGVNVPNASVIIAPLTNFSVKYSICLVPSLMKIETFTGTPKSVETNSIPFIAYCNDFFLKSFNCKFEGKLNTT